MNEQITIIACVPCAEGIDLGYVPYKNSEIIRCEKCNCRMWLPPKCSEKKKEGLPAWCMKCIAKEFGQEAVQAMIPLTDKKMGE